MIYREVEYKSIDPNVQDEVKQDQFDPVDSLHQ